MVLSVTPTTFHHYPFDLPWRQTVKNVTIFTSRFDQTPVNADICSNNNQPKVVQTHDVVHLVQLRLRQQSLLLRSHRRHLSCPIHVKFRLHTQMRHLKGERENMKQRLRCAHRCKTIFIALAQLNFA